MFLTSETMFISNSFGISKHNLEFEAKNPIRPLRSACHGSPLSFGCRSASSWTYL